MRALALLLVSVVALCSAIPVRGAVGDGPRAAYFSDDFESGMGSWDPGGSTWSVTAETWRSPGHCLTDSPGADYGSDQEISATLASPVNLSGSSHPVLTFWHRYELADDYYDYIRVQVSSDGGTTWTTEDLWHQEIQKGWMYEQVSLLDYQGDAAVLVRFQLETDSDATVDDGWHIDDVSICERDPIRMPFPFSDDFESGTGNWYMSGHDWDSTTETARSGSWCMTDSPGDNYAASHEVSFYLAHPLDLTSSVYPVITFWHKDELADDYYDYIRVQVSSDGGTTWTTEDLWHQEIQKGWMYEQVSLLDYQGDAAVLVRFQLETDSDATVDDGWHIDDVSICERDPIRMPFPFSDDFESGTGNWYMSGHDWDSTTETARSGSWCMTDSPGDNYAASHEVSFYLAHPIDLTSSVHPVITFWHKYELADDYYDYIRVQVSSDGGTTWTTEDLWHQEIQRGWMYEQVSLWDYRGSSAVLVRFKIETDSDATVDDGWRIDDVSICERDPIRMPFPFSDDFESGTGNWYMSGHDWDSTTETARSGSWCMTDSPGDNYAASHEVSFYLAHPIDLTSSVHPVITFWHKYELADDYYDYIRVQVSSDGGTTWTTEDLWHQEIQRGWMYEQVSLWDYRGSSAVLVRFKIETDSDATVDDGWHIDDVSICERDPIRMPFPFSDDFESGTGNWYMSGHDWDSTTETARSGSWCMTDSPGDNYAASHEVSFYLAHPIDLTSSVYPVITFWHKYELADDYYDYIRVQVSSDGGTTWTTEDSWHQEIQRGWMYEQVSLWDYRGSSAVLVRFRLETDSDATVDDGWHIDDVSICERDPVRMPFPFSDDFESGVGNWFTSGFDWEPTTETAFTGSFCITESPGSNYSASHETALYLAHPIDLSHASEAVLYFWHKHDLADDYGDDARVQVSTNGGITWTTIESWSGGDPTDWEQETISLNTYLGSGAFTVRFVLSSDSDSNTGDGWHLDAVSILGEPTGIDDQADDHPPAALRLFQNQPNPCVSSTTIAFDLPTPADVNLSVFDVAGRLIFTIVDRPLPAGRHEVTWNGRDNGGGNAASGVYFVRISTTASTQTRRLTLMR